MTTSRWIALICLFLGSSTLGDTPKRTYLIDDAPVSGAVYDAFVARLKLDEKTRINGETRDGGFSTVMGVDTAGQRYRIDERATKAGPRSSVRRELSSTPSAGPGPRYVLDGKSVSPAAYAKFRDALKQVPGTWFCDETTDGGSTGFSGLAADGKRYRVIETSGRGSSDNSISLEESPTKGRSATTP